VEFVKKYLKEEDSKFIRNLSEMRISYQEYDWGLNLKKKTIGDLDMYLLF